MDEDVKLIINFRRLRHIDRCNNFVRIVPEDDAQHSYYVSVLAMIIADELNASESFGHVNVEKVLRKALLHDTDEAFTSDIPHNIKHSSPEFHKAIESAITTKMNQVYENTSHEFQVYGQIARTCKDGVEGEVVDVADMLELALYCYEEVVMGNRLMVSLLEKAIRLVEAKSPAILMGSPIVRKILNVVSHPESDLNTVMDL